MNEHGRPDKSRFMAQDALYRRLMGWRVSAQSQSWFAIQPNAAEAALSRTRVRPRVVHSDLNQMLRGYDSSVGNKEKQKECAGRFYGKRMTDCASHGKTRMFHGGTYPPRRQHKAISLSSSQRSDGDMIGIIKETESAVSIFTII